MANTVEELASATEELTKPALKELTEAEIALVAGGFERFASF